MIEHVAQAIFDAQFGFAAKNAWADYSLHRGAWETAEQHQRDWSLKMARAAIAAMREPTEAMCAEHSEYVSPEFAGHVREDWRAMIDAALSNN